MKGTELMNFIIITVIDTWYNEVFDVYSKYSVVLLIYPNGTLQVKCEEQERIIHELETALQRSALELDRRLTQQQQEYERKIQMLMHQLMMSEGGNAVTNGDMTTSVKCVYWHKMCLLVILI